MYSIKAGDTIPPLRLELTDENGPIDLTHRTPVVTISKGPGHEPIASRSARVTDELAGHAVFEWAPGETDKADVPPNPNEDNPFLYRVEVVLHDDNGDTVTVPGLSYELITISPRLAR